MIVTAHSSCPDPLADLRERPAAPFLHAPSASGSIASVLRADFPSALAQPLKLLLGYDNELSPGKFDGLNGHRHVPFLISCQFV
jgi:hypothetical protein